MISTLRSLSLGSALMLLLTSSSAYATEFVTNGDFEMNGGNGQLGFNTNATGWTVPATPSYFFVFNPQSGGSGTSADKSGANGQFGNLKLWGPGTGSNNGLTLSPEPNAGAFVGSDPAFQNGSLSQTLTGLTVGQALKVTFDYAGAQQFGFDLATTEGWAVSLGGVTQDTALLSTPNHGFTGWQMASFTFTPTSSTEVLSFLSIGTAAAALPPFALLDSVSATQTIPEPSTWVMMVLGFAGLGYAGFRSNRRKPVAID
jgi:PEP-CTERM motif